MELWSCGAVLLVDRPAPLLPPPPPPLGGERAHRISHTNCYSTTAQHERGPNDVNHRKLSRARTAPGTSEGVGPERRQRPSSDLRRSPAPAKDRPSRATRLLASESTPRGDILALQPVHRSRWTACRRGSAAPPTMVLEENIRVSCISLPALLGGFGWWRARHREARRTTAGRTTAGAQQRGGERGAAEGGVEGAGGRAAGED